MFQQTEIKSEPESEKTPEIQNQTVQTNIYLFYQNVQTFSAQQFTNCYIFSRALFELYNDREKINEVDKIFKDPLDFFKKSFGKEMPKFASTSLTELEWIYYRDSHFPVSISRKIWINDRHRTEVQLSTIIKTLGLVKARMNYLVSRLCIDNNISVDPDSFMPKIGNFSSGKVGLQ